MVGMLRTNHPHNRRLCQRVLAASHGFLCHYDRVESPRILPRKHSRKPVEKSGKPGTPVSFHNPHRTWLCHSLDSLGTLAGQADPCSNTPQRGSWPNQRETGLETLVTTAPSSRPGSCLYLPPRHFSCRARPSSHSFGGQSDPNS